MYTPDSDAKLQLLEVQMKRPSLVPEPDGLKRLVRACKGSTFEALRDRAIVRLVVYADVRGKDLAELTLDDLDWSDTPHVLRVRGRGWTPFWGEAEKDLKRYLKVRGTHQDIGSRAVLLDKSRPMTASGVSSIVRRRAKQAGLEGLGVRALRQYSRLWDMERLKYSHERFSPLSTRKRPPLRDGY